MPWLLAFFKHPSKCYFSKINHMNIKFYNIVHKRVYFIALSDSVIYKCMTNYTYNF